MGGQLCNGGLCVASGASPTCQNGIKDGLETAVDCGGGDCAPCAAGACTTNDDCLSLRCVQGTCGPAAPSYLVDEDFETGDFSRFPWQPAADMSHPWVIETATGACHGGSFCARTSPFHASGETSSISLALSVRDDAPVRFWAKTDTESAQHFLRFYVDGVKQLEISGQHDWQLYTFPVAATGPGGPDRVLKWEYSRSAFIDPGHPPYNTVWIDDIDLPAWNTQPTVPRLIAPAGGQVVSTTRPQFNWRSSDADFDRIIYEMQYDTDPAFSAPATTGETSEQTFTPASDLANGKTYYWRARAKDVKDYRWGAWSHAASFFVNTAVQVGLWRQQFGPEFALDTLNGTEVAGDAVRVASQIYTKTDSSPAANVPMLTMTASGLPPAKPGVSATLQLFGCMVVSPCQNADNSRTKQIILDGTQLGVAETTLGPTCQCLPWSSSSSVFTIPNFQTYVQDGTITLVVKGMNEYLLSNFSYSLTYERAVSGATITSVPIALDAFPVGKNWDGLSVDADAGAVVQILDRNQNLVPDAVVPGNAAGLPPGSIKLWNLDASQYPLIYLRATLDVFEQLRRWEVTVNTGYQWDFAHDGDAEGWQALLDGATRTLAVAGGVLRMDAPAAGTDPRLVYQLPADVDAARFKTLSVRLRTSNNSGNDTVTLYWQNNFGQFDPVRSFADTAFLYQQTEVSFDLTQVPAAPNQPWQGRINAIRVDPVQRFFDAVGAATSGWFEVDWIWLR